MRAKGKSIMSGSQKRLYKKRFDRFQRVGSTELKENYPHTPCCARHFPRIPRTDGTLLRTEHASQWATLKVINSVENKRASESSLSSKTRSKIFSANSASLCVLSGSFFNP